MTAKSTNLFDVDPAGLAKLLEQKGKGFAVVELVSNAWDTSATRVEVELTPEPGRPYAQLVVRDDDPEGFADLRHAYTLFAESRRKGDPTTRGRFNMGEKMVIVLCDHATIATTSGTLTFDAKGRRQDPARTERGSVFSGRIRMTREELEDALALLGRLIPPSGSEFLVNGQVMSGRVPIKEFTATLPTVLSDSDGNLRPTERKTTVRVYEPVGVPSLYELGVPVVETGDAYDVDIAQKVPLNMERDNVTPAYLRRLRTVVLNETFDRIDDLQASAAWVSAALEDPRVESEAVAAVVTARYGDRAVIFDPSDREGTKIAVAEGYTVIPSGAFNRQQWERVRESGVVKPAGQVTPSPSSLLNREGGPDSERWRILDPADWSDNVAAVASYARRLGDLLLGFEPTVVIANDPTMPALATWGGRTITFNRGRLGEKWFTVTPATDALILHEFAHHRVTDHLDAGFADEIARLGAKLVQALLDDPAALVAWRPMMVAV